jgi:glycosyltransferase involved in cell wall biosynthesis
VDCTQIPLARTGVGVYADNLIRELLHQLDNNDSLFLLTQDDDEVLRACCSFRSNTHVLSIPAFIFRNRLLLGLFEQLVLPCIAAFHRIDIIHSLHYTFPIICFCRRLVTIHDLTFSLWPEMHTLGRRIVMPFFSRMALKHASGVIFDSESTRKDAEKIFGPSKCHQFVAPLGVASSFFIRPTNEETRHILERLSIRKPFILFLGTIEPRKNIGRLVAAFELIADDHPQHSLVIAGKLGWSYGEILSTITFSPFKDRILRLGYVTAAEKAVLLAACEVLVYPSLYEGFGLPVLEGMAIGSPVITSNVSSLIEVAGDAAITVDPESAEQMSESLEQILSDPDLRGRLSERGRHQALRFPWKQTAEITYGAYCAVLSTQVTRGE